MCGRLACTLCAEDIVKNCQYYNKQEKLEEPKWLDSQYNYKPVYNGPPTTVVPVLSSRNNFCNLTEDEPDYCLMAMRWGMLTPYKTESTANYHTHNARLENILHSTLYKPCLTTGRRCVILADGYYEWQTTQGENHKQPYFLYQTPLKVESSSPTKHLMRFAGLFNIIRDPMGVKYSCTILTTESDSSFSWMHHRIPVILNTEQDLHNWLNHEETKYEDALRKLPKYSSFDKIYELQYYMVNKSYVNNTSCNETKCLERMSVKRKRTLDSWLKKSSK